MLDRRRNDNCEIVSDLRLPDTGAGETALAADLETAAYRLVQEVLTNVTKHARARVVTVTVIAAAGGVRVGVDDDGVGFDAEEETAGFGLAGMRERVRLAGGTFTIASDGHGTRLEASLCGQSGGASAGSQRAA
ncbi:MAG: ATP-binding protein [Solirubrobacteraceae bacterium]